MDGKTISIDEALNTLTVMARCGYSENEMEAIIDRIHLVDPPLEFERFYEQVKTALVTVAVIRAVGYGRAAESYLFRR